MSSDPIVACRNETFLDSDDNRPLHIFSSRCRRFSGRGLPHDRVLRLGTAARG